MTRIVNSRCVLAVRNLEVSTRYYIEVLGFRKDPISAEGWSFLTRDRFRVMLGECANERPAGELGNHSYFAYCNVEGVDDLYRELVTKGASVSSAPTNKAWGLREFGLRTPDGHRIVCGEPTEQQQSSIGGGDEAALTALEEKWAASVIKGDIASLSSLWSETFISTSPRWKGSHEG